LWIELAYPSKYLIDQTVSSIKRIGRLKQSAGPWQVGWKGLPGLLVENPEDPVRIVGAMIVDKASGFILGFHAFTGEDLGVIGVRPTLLTEPLGVGSLICGFLNPWGSILGDFCILRTQKSKKLTPRKRKKINVRPLFTLVGLIIETFA
jgi:hypothetical protein